VHCFIKLFTNLSAVLKLEVWGVDSQLESSLGWVEKGMVSLGLGNKQASLDWPPALWLWIDDSELLWCDTGRAQLGSQAQAAMGYAAPCCQAQF
jgi:hypothetical protein